MSDNLLIPSRRDVLVLGSAAATAAILSPGGVFAAGKDEIRVGVIGCGGRGSGAIRNCLDADPAVKLVAAGDAFQEKAAGMVKGVNGKTPNRVDCPPERIFGGLDAYKKVIACPEVDLVILATPPGFRPYHLEEAIKAKKNVFCEKPVAVDGPGIRKVLSLVEEAKKAGLAIVAGTQRRHQKGYIETINKLHDGAIGEITTARAYWNGNGIWFHDRKPGMTDVAYQLNNWYHFNWLCGDHITEQHVHNLDVINWVMGSHPIAAVGMGGRSHRRQGDPNEVGHIFDHFAVEYEYANGARMYSYCRHAPGCESNVSEAVVGTKGNSQVNAYKINGKVAGDDNGAKDPYVQEHIDLIKSIREGKPLNELQQVAESTMTAILGRMATYTGQRIKWDQGVNSKETTMPENLTWDTKLTVSPTPIPGTTKFV